MPLISPIRLEEGIPETNEPGKSFLFTSMKRKENLLVLFVMHYQKGIDNSSAIDDQRISQSTSRKCVLRDDMNVSREIGCEETK